MATHPHRDEDLLVLFSRDSFPGFASGVGTAIAEAKASSRLTRMARPIGRIDLILNLLAELRSHVRLPRIVRKMLRIQPKLHLLDDSNQRLGRIIAPDKPVSSQFAATKQLVASRKTHIVLAALAAATAITGGTWYGGAQLAPTASEFAQQSSLTNRHPPCGNITFPTLWGAAGRIVTALSGGQFANEIHCYNETPFEAKGPQYGGKTPAVGKGNIRVVFPTDQAGSQPTRNPGSIRTSNTLIIG